MLARHASGVFLWVVLACRSLARGLDDGDNHRELQAKIEELPAELGDLFRHIINRMKPKYRDKATKLLRVKYEDTVHRQIGDTSLPRNWAIAYALLDEAGENGMDIFQWPAYSLMTYEERRSRCKILEAKLQSRCLGLLEMSPVRNETADWCLCPSMSFNSVGVMGHDMTIDSTVEFMHRSLYEFLGTLGAWEISCVGTNDSNFNVSGCLAMMSLSLAQVFQDVSPLATHLATRHLSNAMTHAAISDRHSPHAALPILSHLGQALSKLPRPMPFPIITDPTLDVPSQPIAVLGVEAGLANFVRTHIQRPRRFWDSRKDANNLPLHYHATQQIYLDHILGSQPKPTPSPDLLNYLLSDGGFSANEICWDKMQGGSRSPWQSWLRKLHRVTPAKARELVPITEAFVRNGADVHVADPEMSVSGLIRRHFIGNLECDSRDSNIEGRIIEGRRLLGIIESHCSAGTCHIHEHPRRSLMATSTPGGAPVLGKRRLSGTGGDEHQGRNVRVRSSQAVEPGSDGKS